jgi:hypothetical protein
MTGSSTQGIKTVLHPVSDLARRRAGRRTPPRPSRLDVRHVPVGHRRGHALRSTARPRAASGPMSADPSLPTAASSFALLARRPSSPAQSDELLANCELEDSLERLQVVVDARTSQRAYRPRCFDGVESFSFKITDELRDCLRVDSREDGGVRRATRGSSPHLGRRRARPEPCVNAGQEVLLALHEPPPPGV